MLGSNVLDVALGLVFVFLAISLAAGALTEAVSSVLKLRQATLLAGVRAMVNDPGFTGLARDLYNHALVNPLSAGVAATASRLTAKPAYIDAGSFALALVSLIEARAPNSESLDEALGAIPDEQLRNALQLLHRRASKNREAFLANVGAWFDAAMDRVAGWYKRYTQVISFVAGFLVCVALNADALRIGDALWRRPSLVAELSAGAGGTRADPEAARKVIGELDDAGLLGWQGTVPKGVGGVVSMFLGWIIVAGASLFGAPFWYDVLSRFSDIAGVGPRRPSGPPRP